MLAAGKRLTVRGVTITGGDAGTQSGGGIFQSQGGLKIETCVITGNHAPQGEGGGIYDSANDSAIGLEIFRTWITLNSCSESGGSGLFSTSRLVVSRSTISGNSGGYSVKVYGSESSLGNSTISGNHASSNAGVFVYPDGVPLAGCTLADNSGAELVE